MHVRVHVHTHTHTFRAPWWGFLIQRTPLRAPGSDPQAFPVSLPLQDNLSVPLSEVDLDGSSGVLFPFYDVDTNMLYVVGKVSLVREGGDCWYPEAGSRTPPA